mmetsp:Transcript_4957/g.11027  ORF Transcript_4957/g.11027 Transcript_4957/m.11027 type:complete len:529 (+) Transcript_4957:237-1823(+)
MSLRAQILPKGPWFPCPVPCLGPAFLKTAKGRGSVSSPHHCAPVTVPVPPAPPAPPLLLLLLLRSAFPCWDEPGVKATFTVSVLLPAHLTALSNMPEVSSTHVSSKEGGGKEGDGSLWKRVVFDKSPKMSTYLLAWAIGEFDFVQAATKGGVAIRVYSPPGRGPQGQFALDVAVRSLDFYDDFFKTPYPLPKLDMICITEFAAGAMENWGLVTYRETALMVDEATASPQQKQRVAIVVAHELAHQWFGNLVTMAWWDGLWLNEGFAAFMEHFCIDALFPEYKMWEQYTTDGFSAALRLDALKSSHPVIVPIRHAEEVEQVFDAISYCKGSAVVNMVSAFLGPQQFQAGLQAYMARHAYGNTETGDLWAAWSQASGMDVASLMRTWTTVMGYPYLKVVSEKWREGEVEVTLEQGRFLSDGSAEEGGEGGAPCGASLCSSPPQAPSPRRPCSWTRSSRPSSCPSPPPPLALCPGSRSTPARRRWCGWRTARRWSLACRAPSQRWRPWTERRCCWTPTRSPRPASRLWRAW